MQGKNVSDIIEKYLKKILAEDSEVEISRSEIANLFNVVPSQINYVIKTRFGIPNGYIVESKRGGGGYIRIEKVKLLDNLDIINLIVESIGDTLSYKEGKSIALTLLENDIINNKEVNIILSAINCKTLNTGNKTIENNLRARIMISILNHLKYES
ncbi:CtsR family transcriptional regulator [Apilactobacillus xinyiensis]|uniref:Transcriptional regulator CtsR n=1 Tax=Apilactobacillus xinyiensis TaxID=2841032 RepID=A0ABT0I0K6_9LACO|nr:CtsR family transcriptional regulator [Apilactobacillus xinyiensis]MCK8624365.1 CtsR family transcriptional regulator [Apilactobacillus xinyiensis]MCL0311957.1 CtsR family transcriptional regulator [Apilactobacillus xinyiensis]MCL0319427.1 CtsR family transcriptional regulator [Apilactobacillus xinyiensis]MCL0329645.1 CtsR family transcriptional regulator [Apilactobacillus xinyiensis]